VILTGVIVSLFLHAAIALVLAVVLLDRPAMGDAGSDQEIEMAVMSDTELTELLAMAAGESQPFTEDLVDEVVTFEIQDINSPIADLGKFTNDQSITTGLSGAAIGQIGIGSAVGSAKFFGVEASGSRFAYIVDVSGSMEGGRIVGLRQALIASIDGLTSDARFSIILYSGSALPLTGTTWVRATDANKKAAKQKIRTIQASGDTNPVPAFGIMIGLKPHPDAIYFMTDGEFRQRVEDQLLLTVGRLYRDEQIPIHCITFMERGAERLMRRIARHTRGTYTHLKGAAP